MVVFNPLKPQSSLANLVVLVLGENWQLNARGVHLAVCSDFNRPVSFQAVHKALKKLGEECIVEKSGKNYSINLEWVDSMIIFCEKIKEKNQLIG